MNFEEILKYLMLIIIGYFIAKMFSKTCNGFSVGGSERNMCTSPDAPDIVRGKPKQMAITLTENDGDKCNRTASTCVDNDTILVGWSETRAPFCTENTCTGEQTPKADIPNEYRDENHHLIDIPNVYDGTWSTTTQHSDNLYTLSYVDVDSLCYPDEDTYKEFWGCLSGTRALCQFKINTDKKDGKGGKCDGVTSGVPDYCKKNEYCCEINGNNKCCTEPCSTTGGTCRD